MENNRESHSFFAADNGRKWVQPENYYVHFYKNFDMVIHSHNRIEIVYVVLGELRVEYLLPDGESVTLLCHSSNYVFIDADVPHKISVDNIATKMCNIEFLITEGTDADFTLSALKRKNPDVKRFLSADTPVLKIVDDGKFLQNLLLIQKYIDSDITAPCDNYLSYQFCALFTILAKQAQPPRGNVHGIIYIKKALSYIYDNYNADLTLTGLARLCGISPNYLNQIFSQNMGTTVNNFINRYRIGRATALLESSGISIEEIYKQIGYRNKMSFHKNFLKFVGITPQKYRKSTQKSTIVQTNLAQSFNNYFLD